MKNLKSISVIALAIFSFSFVSCDKQNTMSQGDLTTDIVGTYKGSITTAGTAKTADDATSDVTPIDNKTVQVHCYGGDLDTTFNVTLYPNGEEMMTGMTGEDFEEMYGYMPDYMQEYMNSGNMGDDMMDGESGSWMTYDQHMGENHDDNDQHDGSFNMSQGTFDYTFNEGTSSSVSFSGKK